MENPTRLIDISVPLHPELPVWPDGDSFQTPLRSDIKKGDICNVTSIHLNAHMGTHIDAPLHFIDDGETTDNIPLEKMNGSCYVVDLSGIDQITADHLEAVNLPIGVRRILLKTNNSNLWTNFSHPFYEDFCALKPNAAEWLVNHGIDLVGIDYLSISPFRDPPEVVHQILLEENIVILETINLKEVLPGYYDLVCLPLKIKGLEGNPVRAVLKPKK